VTDRIPGIRVLVGLGIVALALHIVQLVALPFRIEQLFIVIFTAVLLAAAVAPAAEALERRHIPRGVTVLLIYLAALLVLAGVVALIVPLVADEADLLRQKVPDYNADLQDFVRRFSPQTADRLTGRNVLNELGNRLESVAGKAPGFALDLGSVLGRIVIVLVMSYFMAVEEGFAQRVMRRFTPPCHRDRVSGLLGRMGNKLGPWARAQILLALSVGFAFGVGLWVLRVPYAVTLGVVGGILEIIPYVGGFITVVLALLVATTEGPLQLIGVVVWYTIVVQAEAHILAPKLMERALGLHPLLVIVALFIGTESLGFFGALLAVPIAVVLQVLIDEFYAFDDQEPRSGPLVPAPAPGVPDGGEA
jgi:predicted PurR-regulated permease PerM